MSSVVLCDLEYPFLRYARILSSSIVSASVEGTPHPKAAEQATMSTAMLALVPHESILVSPFTAGTEGEVLRGVADRPPFISRPPPPPPFRSPLWIRSKTIAAAAKSATRRYRSLPPFPVVAMVGQRLA